MNEKLWSDRGVQLPTSLTGSLRMRIQNALDGRAAAFVSLLKGGRGDLSLAAAARQLIGDAPESEKGSAAVGTTSLGGQISELLNDGGYIAYNVKEDPSRVRLLKTIVARPLWPYLVGLMEDIGFSATEAEDALIILLLRVWNRESGYRSDLVSSTGARGIGQVLPSTYKSLVKPDATIWAHLGVDQAEAMPWGFLSHEQISSSGPNVLSLPGVDAAMASTAEFLRILINKGIPTWVDEVIPNAPKWAKYMAAFEYYYHNGTKMTPRQFKDEKVTQAHEALLRKQTEWWNKFASKWSNKQGLSFS